MLHVMLLWIPYISCVVFVCPQEQETQGEFPDKNMATVSSAECIAAQLSGSEEEEEECGSERPLMHVGQGDSMSAQLFSACASGDRVRVRSLLERGCSPTTPMNGVSPYDMAMFFEHHVIAKELLSHALRQLFPLHDIVLIRNIAAKATSVEEASALVLNDMEAVDASDTSSLALSPRDPMLLLPRPPQTVRLKASEVRKLERKQDQMEEARKQALATAAAKAREEDEQRQLRLEAQLRTRVVLEKVSNGDFEEAQSLWALQPDGRVLQPHERGEAGTTLLKLANSALPDVGLRTQFLLTIGADRTIKDMDGCTVLDLAAKAPQDEFALAIREYIASLKSALRARLRRVFMVAYRFHEVLQEVSLRPGYSGFKRCRDSFEGRVVEYDLL